MDDTHQERAMNMLYDSKAPKKATNLSINSNLLTKSRDLDINLSATLENALEKVVRESTRARWLKENKTALKNCNTLADEHGLFADKHRDFNGSA
jgi:antitoxin CcdA